MRSVEIDTPLSAADVARVLTDVLVHQREGRRIPSDYPGWMRFGLGSRALFGLWGGSRNAPATLCSSHLRAR